MTAEASIISGAAIRQCTVTRIEGPDVLVAAADGEELVCEVLSTGALASLLLAPKDTVLVWQQDSRAGRGVILGRVGLSHAEIPEEVVLEATESLILRVGDSSIRIRADGKVLIKGKDLVSHAQNVNRIKGGAVAIN